MGPHWISVISVGSNSSPQRLGEGGIATCSRRSRLCGNRRKEPVRARGPEISAVTCPHRLIVKGVAREHRRLAVIDAELLFSFAAQRHHVPEVSCASTTRTAAGHLDA